MAQSKPTPGPWTADTGYSLHGSARDDMMDYRCSVDMPAPFSENEYGGFEHFETQTGAIALGRTPEEAQTNARLIAEAGTVAHETGLTQRQLAEQRAELLAALSAIAALEGRSKADAVGLIKRARHIAKCAIAKAEGGAS